MVLIISLDSQAEEMSGAGSSLVERTWSVKETSRCITPYLLNLCKLIDKFQNLIFYCFDKYWNEYEYLVYFDVYQLVMI
jgi:hypothetical protein